MYDTPDSFFMSLVTEARKSGGSLNITVDPTKDKDLKITDYGGSTPEEDPPDDNKTTTDDPPANNAGGGITVNNAEQPNDNNTDNNDTGATDYSEGIPEEDDTDDQNTAGGGVTVNQTDDNQNATTDTGATDDQNADNTNTGTDPQAGTTPQTDGTQQDDNTGATDSDDPNAAGDDGMDNGSGGDNLEGGGDDASASDSFQDNSADPVNMDEVDKKNATIILLRNFISLYKTILSFKQKVSEAKKESVLASVTFSQVQDNLIRLASMVYKYIVMYYDNNNHEMNLYNYNYFKEIMRLNLEMLRKVVEASGEDGTNK